MYRIGALLITLFQFTTLANAQYQLDTLSHRQVGPGMVHTHVVDQTGPWNINIFITDLTDPYLEIESLKANDRLRGLERTSSMADRRNFEGHRIVGAVNGDFYAGGGEPINIQVVRGELVKREANGRTAVGFTPENAPMMAYMGFSGEVIAGDGTIAINGVNEPRGADQLILYNSFMGTSTGANEFGTEVALEMLDAWVANDTLRGVVRAVENGVGDMEIADGEVVLSAHGVAAATLGGAVAVDDTIRLVTRVQPAPGLVKEMIGGGPFLLVDGEVDVGPRGDGGVRHPRTAIGFSADSTKLIVATVDGRQSISIGMTLHELALLMQQAGAATAMNLDGGGSTTMVVRGDIVNSPSDTGGERSVSNALGLFSTAPVGDIDHIRLADRMVRLFRGSTYQVQVEAVDEFYNPLPIDSAQLSFDVDSQIGIIDGDGLLQTNMTADSGYVRVTYDTFQDSLRVMITDIGRIEISPVSVTTDTIQAVTFDVAAFDTDNVGRSVAASEYVWSTTNEAVGSVSDEGVFSGLSHGETYVVVSYGALRDSAHVFVEVHSGYTLLDSLDNVTGWTVGSENAGPGDEPLALVDSAATLGSHSIALSYRFTPDQQLSRVYMNREIGVQGLPDSIMVDVWSNESGHRVFIELVDSEGDTYTRYPPGRRPDLPTDGFVTVAAGANASGMLHPIRFARVGVQLASSGEDGEQTGTILFDNLRVSYPGHTGTTIVSDEVPADRVVLHPNFPNPFSRQTTFAYELDRPADVRIEVFDLLGRRVGTIEDRRRAAGRHEVSFEASDLPSGMYFIRLEAGEVFKSRSISVLH